MARDCKAKPDNEFGFVRFFGQGSSVNLDTSRNRSSKESQFMFATNRSPLAVLVPLALLVAVAAWSNRPDRVAAPQQASEPALDRTQTVAANFRSR